MADRIPNEDLLRAGLDLMARGGKPLARLDSPGRAMKYKMANGKTVRVRTCNDHILVVLAAEATKDAKLNIEGTDYLLIVMPEIERTPGNIIAYLVPTQVAVDAARSTHWDWRATNPNTHGDNRTWNLWFDPGGKAGGYAEKWKQYRLEGAVTSPASEQWSPATSDLKSEVETARTRIAAAAGVSPTAVRITVDFGV